MLPNLSAYLFFIFLLSVPISGCEHIENSAKLPVLANLKSSEKQTKLPDVKQFPDDIGWINIKKDYGVKGDGKTDDTKAIQQALDDSYADYNRPTVIYFPQGTYLISDTIKFPQNTQYHCCVTFQGQSRQKTILKLKDNTESFGDAENPKAMIRTKQGNEAFRYFIRDLTVNTGSGNPAAIGIDYISNNRGAIKDVIVKSEDGQGKVGIDMTREWPGPSLLKNVTVEGFDYGIRVARVEFSLTLEHIKLKNQNIAGIFNKQNSIAIRGLESNNSVPVIYNEEGGLVILLDGDFQGGSPFVSAIKNNAYLYARNISAKGYKSAIKNQNKVLSGSSPTEYISHPVYSLFDNNPQKSLNLPVEETPDFHDNNLKNWANVRDYPSIQAAMNSGKSTIYFPRGYYEASGRIEIPSTVRKIVGFESFINRDKDLRIVFQILEDSKHPLIIDGMILQGATIEHTSPRTLAILHSKVKKSLTRSGKVLQNSPNSGKLFLEDVQMFVHLDYPQDVWARQLNAESRYVPYSKIVNKGGKLWILGLKIEGTGPVIETKEGGQTEMLGTLLYPAQKFTNESKLQPAFINQDSSMSLIYSLSAYGENRNYAIQIQETQDEETKLFKSEDLSGRVMPLFTGFEK